MDLFDSIDNAIDNLLAGKGSSHEGPDASNPDDMGLDLRAAIAEENLGPVLSLVAILDRCRRSHVLAALWGSVSYLGSVDTLETRGKTTAAIQQILVTKRGTVRKRLTKAETARLHDLAARLGVSDPAADDRMAVFVTKLQSVAIIEAEDIAALFGAGIWRASQLRGAPAEEVTRLSQVETEKVRVLKTAFGAS